MNKGDLIDAIAAKAAISKRAAAEALEATLQSVMEAVSQGDKVTLVGFGTFEQRLRQPREARNPKTGEAIQLAERKVPSFSAGKQFKELVLR